jgi:heme-degrading monooxygenase HmoA
VDKRFELVSSIETREVIMVYEVRFQTVDPERRSEYVKMYKQAIQEIKLAGCRGGLILCSESDPASVLVLLEWESKEHHLRWRNTPPHTRFRTAVEGWQSKPSTGGYYLAETI